MFNKLKELLGGTQEQVEFKPRQQGLRSKPPQEVQHRSNSSSPPESSSNVATNDVVIGFDYMDKKLESRRNDRIQSKVQLLKQLQKECGNG